MVNVDGLVWCLGWEGTCLASELDVPFQVWVSRCKVLLEDASWSPRQADRGLSVFACRISHVEPFRLLAIIWAPSRGGVDDMASLLPFHLGVIMPTAAPTRLICNHPFASTSALPRKYDRLHSFQTTIRHSTHPGVSA